MKGIGIGIVRWLVGIILGLVAASFLFGLVARVSSSPTSTAVDGPLSLLMAGFAIAFFPAIFVVGTKRPRQVIRRAFVVLAIEGVIALVLGAYQVITGLPLIPVSAFGWLGSATEALGSFAGLFSSPILVAVLGLGIFALCMFIVIALRERAAAKAAPPSAPARASLPPAGTPSTSARPPAIAQPTPTPQVTPTAQQPTSAAPKDDDEDAQLMADLESLRKRLPTMGVDESGTSGKS